MTSASAGGCLDVLELFKSGLQRGHFLLEPCGSDFGNPGRLAIRRFHRGEIALDAVIDFLHPLLQFATREVAVMGVHRLELAAINGDDRLREQIQLAAQYDKLPADIA
jgi:hypothetical protein